MHPDKNGGTEEATFTDSELSAARKDTSATSFFWTGVTGCVVMTIVGIWSWTPMDAGASAWMALLCLTGALGHYLLSRWKRGRRVRCFLRRPVLTCRPRSIDLVGDTTDGSGEAEDKPTTLPLGAPFEVPLHLGEAAVNRLRKAARGLPLEPVLGVH